ncbi:glycosyltransferase family 4 protein [Methylomonas sp. HYX-M1]|uniref:glycosyltransferase family 4 protein n=1 Tax=Methylomonas sp. HYX-M1 TaxID=3139307 RepID=UPI00345BFDE0
MNSKNAIRSPFYKVLHIGPLPPPVGGMATVIESLTQVLQSFIDIRILNNVKTTPINRSLMQGIAAQLSLLARLVTLGWTWKPQIVHIHTCSWFTFWRSSLDVLIARLLRKRVLLHIHGGEFKLFLESLSPLKASIARLIFFLCSRVIVLGHSWKLLLSDWCDPTKLEIVQNGTSIEAKQKLPNDDVFMIVCFANYDKRKGQADLLKAVSTLKAQDNRRILVALLGTETEVGQRQTLLTLAQVLGLADNVFIPGPVTGKDKDAWWMKANCFCIPSYNECMPMSILEAMAKGIPVVATRVGSIPEMVEDQVEAFLYEAGDVSSLSSCLQRLLDYPEVAERLGCAGRDRQIRDFNIEQTANRLLSIYTSIEMSDI